MRILDLQLLYAYNSNSGDGQADWVAMETKHGQGLWIDIERSPRIRLLHHCVALVYKLDPKTVAFGFIYSWLIIFYDIALARSGRLDGTVRRDSGYGIQRERWVGGLLRIMCICSIRGLLPTVQCSYSPLIHVALPGSRLRAITLLSYIWPEIHIKIKTCITIVPIKYWDKWRLVSRSCGIGISHICWEWVLFAFTVGLRNGDMWIEIFTIGCGGVL